MTPKGPYGRQKSPPTPPKNEPKKNTNKKKKKTQKNKPVLASEREARSRLEHCRKNVSQLLHSQDEQTQMQQE